jgi:methionyl aminopeptidase
VPPSILRPDYADRDDGEPLSETDAKRGTMTIPVYTAEQIKGARKACSVTADVLAIATKIAKPGVTTDEIDRYFFIYLSFALNDFFPSEFIYLLAGWCMMLASNVIVIHLRLIIAHSRRACARR